MARTSSTSNPTGLKEIDRRHVALVVTHVGSDKYVSISRIDSNEYALQTALKVVCIARAGNSTQRFELGHLGNWDKSPQLLKNLDENAPVRFRLILHPEGSPKLVATCENLRVRDDSQGESLLPMEPADLGEELWQFICRSDGPVLLFNQAVFPTANVASSYPAFRALVMPEALRQVSRILAAEPDRLADDTDPFYEWGQWLDDLGIERIEDDADESEQSRWTDEIVRAFAARNKFATHLKRQMTEAAND